MVKRKYANFWLNLDGGAYVLQKMAQGVVKQSAQTIQARATSIVPSVMARSDRVAPPTFTVETKLRITSRGARAVAIVRGGGTARQMYLAGMALAKSIDAGRVRL